MKCWGQASETFVTLPLSTQIYACAFPCVRTKQQHKQEEGVFQVWIATDFEIALSWVWHRYVLSSHDSKKPDPSNLHRQSLTGNPKFTFWFPLAPWQVVQELLVPGRVLGASAHQYWPLGIWRQRTRLQLLTKMEKRGLRQFGKRTAFNSVQYYHRLQYMYENMYVCNRLHVCEIMWVWCLGQGLWSHLHKWIRHWDPNLNSCANHLCSRSPELRCGGRSLAILWNLGANHILRLDFCRFLNWWPSKWLKYTESLTKKRDEKGNCRGFRPQAFQQQFCDHGHWSVDLPWHEDGYWNLCIDGFGEQLGRDLPCDARVTERCKAGCQIQKSTKSNTYSEANVGPTWPSNPSKSL